VGSFVDSQRQSIATAQITVSSQGTVSIVATNGINATWTGAVGNSGQFVGVLTDQVDGVAATGSFTLLNEVSIAGTLHVDQSEWGQNFSFEVTEPG
jgi:hypothetical protein